MPAASINSASLWANQISALSAQCAAQANALSASTGNAAGTSAVSGGGSLFADLVSALTRGSVTINSPGAATAANPGSSISSPTAVGSTAGRSQIAQDLQAFTQSLFQALASNQSAQLQSGGSGNAASAGIGVPSAATSASVANLNTTFNRLMNDLSVSTSPRPAGSTGYPAAGGAAIGVLTPNPSAVLPRLLQGMLQHRQQQGSMAASVVHVVA